MSENELKRKAAESAARRGHNLGEWGPGSTFYRDMYRADCQTCGMSVTVDLSPPPNGIDLSGEAVALNCLRKRP